MAVRYSNGEKLAVLAAAFGCTITTIRAIAKRAGLSKRNWGGQRRRFTENQLTEMTDRWLAGDSQNAIATDYGVSQSAISHALGNHGIAKEQRYATRERHGRWRGGRTAAGGGYMAVHVPVDDPLRAMAHSGGYVLEHRLVMARTIGRPLLPNETVHHLNGRRGDNRIENLQLRTGRHGSGASYKCLDCGSTRIGASPL